MDGAGGNAGTLNIGQTPPVPTTLTTGNITASGGDAAATAPGGFVGGTGATIAITTSGTGNYGNIDTRGGTSAATGGGSSADGADGGSVSLTSTGNTLTSGSINTSGRAGLDLLPAGLSRGGNAGDVTLSGVGATVTGAITALGGNNPLGIAPPAIIPGTGGIVNVSGTTGNLSVQGIDSSGGDATIIGFSGNAGTITLTGDGGITLNGNITAATGTPAGGFPPGSGAAITINDNTTLATQDIDISTGNTTGNVTFANNSTVNGMFALTLTAGNGDVAIQGAVGGTTPLTLLDVVSANNVSLAAVTTQGILTPTTINIGSVSAIAFVINLSGNLSTDGSGLAMPTGNIRLNGNVTLTADVTLNTNDRSFNSGAPTAATGNITLVTGTVQSNPADSFGLGIDAGDNNVDLTGVTLTGLDHLVVITTGNASLAAVSVDDGSGNPLGAGVGIEVNAGNADLNGNLDADGGNIDLSDTATVVLNTDVSINTTANGGDIDLGSTNNTTITDSGTRQLTLNAANADITLDNVDVDLITFTAGNSVTLFGDLTASNAGAGSLNFGNIDDGNTITLAGNVTLTARSIDTVGEIINGNFNLTIVGGAGGAEFQAGLGILAAIGTGMGPAITVNSTSSTTFFNIVNTASGISGNNAAGLITFQENVTTAAGDTDTAIDGNVTLDGLTFTSGGNVTFGNAPVDSITLSSAAVLIRAAVKNITLEGATTGAQNLTLNSTGITLINGNIGVPTPVLSLTTNAGGTTNIMAATINASGGTITFNNPVVLLADTTHTDTGTTGITYGNTVDGAFSLTANTSGGTGNINFNGNVGVAAELTQLTGTINADINFGAATSSVNTNGGNITFTAAGSINTAAAISLDAGDAANMDGGAGGDVTLNAMAGSIASSGNLISIAANGDTGLAAGGDGGAGGTVDVDAGTSINLGTVDSIGGAASGAGGAGGNVDINAGTTLAVAAISSQGGAAVGSGNGGDAGTINLTGNSGITLNGDLLADGGSSTGGGNVEGDGANITVNSNVTLGADIRVDSQDGTGNGTVGTPGDIVFSGTVDGNFDLTLVSGDGATDGNISMSGAVGGATPLTFFDIESAADVSLTVVTTQSDTPNPTINIGSVNNLTGTLTLTGNLATDGAGQGNDAGGIRIASNGAVQLDVSGGPGTIVLDTNDATAFGGTGGGTDGTVTFVGAFTVASSTNFDDGLTIDTGSNNVDITAATLIDLDHLVIRTDLANSVTTGNVTVGDGTGTAFAAVDILSGTIEVGGNIDASGEAPTGNVTLFGNSDITGPAAGRVIGLITANELVFTSGSAGGNTTINTTIASGNIALTGAGDLTVNETDGVTLTNANGFIDVNAGNTTIVLNVDSSATDADANDILITASNGDIDLGTGGTPATVTAGSNGDVMLEATSGAITDTNDGSLITADELELIASTGIGEYNFEGATQDPIDTAVNTVAATTDTGDISIFDDVGDLAIGNVDVDGDGNITVGIDIMGGRQRHPRRGGRRRRWSGRQPHHQCRFPRDRP